ncbi:unnamed protein product, partial [Adineta steineri]
SETVTSNATQPKNKLCEYLKRRKVMWIIVIIIVIVLIITIPIVIIKTKKANSEKTSTKEEGTIKITEEMEVTTVFFSTHFCNPESTITSTSATTLPTTSTSTTSAVWVKIAPDSVIGDQNCASGGYVPSATLSDCESGCLSVSGCTAVDWNVNGAGCSYRQCTTYPPNYSGRSDWEIWAIETETSTTTTTTISIPGSVLIGFIGIIVREEVPADMTFS